MGAVYEIVAHQGVLGAEDLCENGVELVPAVVAVAVAVGAFHVDIAYFVVDESFQDAFAVKFCHAVELGELWPAQFHCLVASLHQFG